MVINTRTQLFSAAALAALVHSADAWTAPPINMDNNIPPAVVAISHDSSNQEFLSRQHAAPLLRDISSTATMATMADHVREWSRSTNINSLVGIPPAFAEDITATGPPTKDEIVTLQKAFSSFYGAQRDPQAALPLLDESVKNFERQPPDERAGLYRVRGDCKMALGQAPEAIEDYGTAIDLLRLPESIKKADPVELPASILGRARAIRSLGIKATPEQLQTAAGDYKEALALSSREDWDTIDEKVEDGAKTNPYAAWEYGMALRRAGKYEEARAIHTLTSDLFDAIGDRPRAVISLLDAGIDAASSQLETNKDGGAIALLKKGVGYTTTAESRDVGLLQRVVAKEGEARIVLASLEWSSDKSLRSDAEKELTTACERLDQLEQDALERAKKSKKPPSAATATLTRLRFNIDDYPGALETSCARLTKNRDFQADRLEHPEVLLDAVQKLNQLK